MKYDDYLEDKVTDPQWVHIDKLPDFEHMKDHLLGIIEAVYETGNITMLESSLEEVAHQLGLNYPIKDVKIEKKKQGDLLQWYLGYQRGQLDRMNKNGEQDE